MDLRLHSRHFVLAGLLLLAWTLSAAGQQCVYDPAEVAALTAELAAATEEQVQDIIEALPDPPDENTCNCTIQNIALQVLFRSTAGQYWRKKARWMDSSLVCELPSMRGVLLDLPPQCCWQGVTCCTDLTCCTNDSCESTWNNKTACGCSTLGTVSTLSLTRNNMTGLLPQKLLAYLSCDLNLVDLTFNRLTGSINDTTIQALNATYALGLSYNNLIGDIPIGLGKLPNLHILDLTSNNLTGGLPEDFCNGREVSNITDLLLANNMLSGSFAATQCDNLIVLDLANNQFSGPMPSFEGFSQLRILRLANNGFTGLIPDTVGAMPWITNIDVSHNALEGTIPSNLSTLRLLAQIRLNDNKLVGTLPNGTFSTLGTLIRLNLASNAITGTIPNEPIAVETVVEVDLSSNNLYGTIPMAFQQFAKPNITVNLLLNFLSCCGTWDTSKNATEVVPPNDPWYNDEVYTGVNYTAYALGPLPPYLKFSSVLVPVRYRSGNPNATAEYSNMRCPALRTNTPGEDSFDNLLDWEIDPDYYMFKGCTCDADFKFTNVTQDGKVWRFACKQVDTPWYTQAWAVALVVVGCIGLVITILFLLLYRKGARPAVVQQFKNLQKRVQGEPKEGMVALVTTDIEGYSDLMKREPDLMGKGLRIHNYCIDKARWHTFGFNIEQEGDSFTIAFHDPFDAVVFCMQAQLLLNRMEWPERLLNVEGGMERQRKGSVLAAAIHGAARILLRGEKSVQSDTFSRASALGPSAPPPAPGSMESVGSGSLPAQNNGASGTKRKGSSGFMRLSKLKLGGAVPAPRSTQPVAIPEEQSDIADAASVGTAGTSPAGTDTPPDGLRDGQPSNTSTNPPALGILEGQVSSSSRLRLASSLGVAGHSERGGSAVFNGLRVRMGVVTGRLEKGMSLRSSPLMDRAKVVSDAAAGGQVLMDGFTFLQVKERLVELGAVDHNGLSLSKMHLGRPTLLEWLLGRRTSGHEADAAVVLDMGRYQHKSKLSAQGLLRSSTLAAAAAVTAATEAAAAAESAKAGDKGAVRTDGIGPLPSAMSAVDHPPNVPTAADANTNSLHLYQILSPCLVERARIFGAKLALKDDWVCTDPSYFAAPGATAAGLGLDSCAVIPGITMVFSAMEGVKEWKLGNDKVKRAQLQHIIRDTVANTLRPVKSGYLCRMQEDEFKYMVAFAGPADAARWCLLMQDALLWQEWPDWLLRLDKTREERDEKGNVIWRGPRLRMGMCHGCPRAIVPDHMGRADYHGASINSAARYMDAAAHGGQVVCEEETALAVFANLTGNGHDWADTPDSIQHAGGRLPSVPPAPAPSVAHPDLNLTTPFLEPSNLPPSTRDSGPASNGSFGAPSSSDHLALPMPPGVGSRGASAVHAGLTTLGSIQESLPLGSEDEGEATLHALPGSRPLSVLAPLPDPTLTAGRESAGGLDAAERTSPSAADLRSTAPPFEVGATDSELVAGAAPPAATDGLPSVDLGSGIVSSSDALQWRSLESDATQSAPSNVVADLAPSASGGSALGARPPGAVRSASHAPSRFARGVDGTALGGTSSLPTVLPTSLNRPTPSLLTRPGAGRDPVLPPPIVVPGAGVGARTDARGSPGPTMWRTGITALRIGSFKFKGSPEEIPMAQLVLDELMGRHFPPDPPKGKGGRVRDTSGLVANVTDVDLPNASRLYYAAWKAKQGTQPPTPRERVAQRDRVKGWAVSIIASRASSMNALSGAEAAAAAGLAGGGSVDGGGTGSGGRGLGSLMGRSKHLLNSMIRMPSSRAVPPSRSALATQSEFNLASLTPSRPPRINHGRADALVVGERRDRDGGLEAPAGRSDSISSFIVAAEEGLLSAAAAADAAEGGSGSGSRGGGSRGEEGGTPRGDAAGGEPRGGSPVEVREIQVV